jgi:hypothetical protein
VPLVQVSSTQYTRAASFINNQRMIAKTKTSYKRGSEWRKWDLHVHSPASFNYKGDYPALVNQIGSADCAVIGINDYFSVAGYKELLRRLHQPSDSDGNKAYRDALERLRPKTLLPVVECRMTNMVLSKKAPSGTRFNFHIVFSNELDPNDIERFLMGLKAGDQSIGARRYSDPEFLFNEVAVDFSEVVAALNADATYKGKFLIWMPYDEYGGIDSIDPRTHKLFKDGLIRKADMLGSGNRKQADFFLWKDTKFSEEEYKLWFGKRKPCVKGSDSHNANDEVGRLKDQDSKPTERYCWIKADPTFDGLRQIQRTVFSLVQCRRNWPWRKRTRRGSYPESRFARRRVQRQATCGSMRTSNLTTTWLRLSGTKVAARVPSPTLSPWPATLPSRDTSRF